VCSSPLLATIEGGAVDDEIEVTPPEEDETLDRAAG
jgi:hypothetical protein